MWVVTGDSGTRYTIEDAPVRKGGQASVFRATVEGTDIRLAVKVGLDPGDPTPLFHERAVLQRLTEHHAVGRHVIALYDGGRTEDGRGFIVLRWVEHTLAEWVVGRPLQERLAVAVQLCEAIVALHAAGDTDFCVHRDLKPWNVLIEEDERGFPLIFLADFGIARTTSLNPTMTTANWGTDGYMSPEQAMPGERKPTKGWDGFALGATALFCLVEHAPLSARTDVRRLRVDGRLGDAAEYYDFTRMQALSDQDVADVADAVRKALGPGPRAEVLHQRLVAALARSLQPDAAARGTPSELLVALAGASAVLADGLEPVRRPGPPRRRWIGAGLLLGGLAGAGLAAMVGIRGEPGIGMPDCRGSEDTTRECFRVGKAYKQGTDGREVNERKAFVYFQSACDAESWEACTWLGSMHDNGEAGLRNDGAIGASYHTRACEHRNGDGCNRLGYVYDKGIGVPRDAARAALYYESACNLKWGLGCVNLAETLNARHDADPRRLHDLYDTACRLGTLVGCTRRDELELVRAEPTPTQAPAR